MADKRKCPCCGEYIDIDKWPTYNGKYYTYCRECKKATQRLWVKQKREIEKTK